jgi:hypothetical protein
VAAGYSGTPLWKKLGIKPGARLLLDHAPDGFEQDTLVDLPDGVKVSRRAGAGPYDVVVMFVSTLADLAGRFPALKERLHVDGGLWVAWPKKQSGVPTDVNENHVRALGLAQGLVDNKVCAVDEVWSGLRMVYRLKDRPAVKARSPRT